MSQFEIARCSVCKNHLGFYVKSGGEIVYPKNARMSCTTSDDCSRWIADQDHTPSVANLQHCETCRCGRATMDPLTHGV